ncbi:MAG: Putative xanthine dehydrogenase molybdenum-binding subunit XdhA [Marinobacterium sp. xm-d-530]|nr:MAG: Putative xanthine dehydrogenase molybdenum-binding subunit XdhA [Marinobacterium sp. xm-d-530]
MKPVGVSVTHDSALLHVTGRARYVDDTPLPEGTLFGALGQATITRGRVLSIDLSAVSNAPGVISVLTSEDIPGIKDIGPVFPGDPLLVDGDVLFHGQPIFLVVATDERLARSAALLAEVEYEESNPILSIEEAKLQAYRVRPPHVMQRGDVSTIGASEHQISGELSIGGQEHLYLEGQASLAIPTEEGGIHLLCSTQHPTEVQTLVSEVLGLPFHEVVVEVRRMGGAFGGKETQAAPWACLASLAAHKLGRPVKLRLPRSTDMAVTGKRHPFINQYQVGFRSDGRIDAVQIDINGDCGCSPDLSDSIVDRAMFHSDNAYYYPAAKISGERWRTDKVSNTAFRGFGGPQGVITAEAMLDDIARVCQQDPLDTRLLNLYSGQQTHYGQTVDGTTLREIMTRLRESSDYDRRRQKIAKHNLASTRFIKGLALTPVKFGISFTVKHLNQAGVLVHIYTDGSVLVSQAGTEMGQGLYTKVAQVVASVLGIAVDRVKMSSTRTDKVPNTSPTAASSGSDMNGMAAHDAASTLKSRIAEFIANRESISPETIEFKEGLLIWGTKTIRFEEAVKAAYMDRVQLSATGFYKTPNIWYDRASAQGNPFLYYANGAACSEVIIDRLTGATHIERVDILHDTGNSLNPALDIGQIEGGFVQGVGWLTSEELKWDDKGRLLTNSPATYKIPAISDRPTDLKIDLLDKPNSAATIARSKAVGEPPFMLGISVWCAIRDAISSVSGYRISPTLNAPATPEAILNAISTLEDSL